MRRLCISAALAALSIVLAAVAQSAPDLQRLPDDVIPTAYDLALTIDPRETRFAGEARIAVTLANPTTEFAVNGRNLRVTRASLTPEGAAAIAATYREDAGNPGWARITLASPAPAGKALLTIAYDAPFTDRVSGLYRLSGDDGSKYAFSQLEPLDARRVFPAFDDPRFKTPFTVAVTAKSGDVVVTNGPLVRAESASAGVRHVFARTEPLPTYLIAFAVGPFDVVEAQPLPKTALRAREVPLRGIALKGKGQYFERALSQTRPLVEWFETYFATPYPYAKLDLIASPVMPGGMENAGAIIYGENYILLTSDATETAVAAFAEIHAHELAHQWFGNLVTAAWWDDIWLNESFATWASYRAVAAVMPDLGFDRSLRGVTNVALSQDARRDAKPVRHAIRTEDDVDGAFDFTTYYKGAAVLAMMEDYLGQDRFRDGLRAHMRRFPHATTTSKDFYASLEQALGDKNIATALESFVGQSHAPIVTGTLSCASPPRQSFSQRTYAPLGWTLPEQRWTIPLCTKAYGTGASAHACTMAAQPDASIALAGAACPQLTTLNNGAGYFRQAYDAQGWKALAANLARLSPPEQTAAIDGARAAFVGNALSPPAFVDLLNTATASTDESILATAIAQVQALERSVPDSDAQAYRTWVRSTLAGTFARAHSRYVAEALLRALTNQGRDPVLRKRLADLTPTFLTQRPSLSSTPRDLVFRVAVEDGDAGVFASILAAASASEDVVFRWDALRALGHAPRPQDRAAFTKALSKFEPFLITLTLYELSGEQTTAAFAWDSAKGRFDELLAAEPAFAQHIAVFARGLCSAEGRVDLTAFIEAKKARLKNYEATLASVVDAIDHCAAVRAAQGAPLGAALRAHATKVAALDYLDAGRDSRAIELLSQISTQPVKAEAGFGGIVAACGGKFPKTSPLAICATAPTAKACHDIRLMMNQCMRR